MKGSYNICVKNARLQYKLTLNRNITVLRGDSATGKTTLIEMIASYQTNGINSGVTVASEKPCVVLTSFNWKINLDAIHDSFVFIDEQDKFVASKEFAQCVKNSDNYYVIATRNNLFDLPYSIREIYGIKNKAGNRYQGTKRLYSEFYPLYKADLDIIRNPEIVIVEDSNSGYDFFSKYFNKYNIPCVSAGGKSNIYNCVLANENKNILIIADGAAFGSEIDSLVKLYKRISLMLYLPESFEWIILNSNLFNEGEVKAIIDNPSDYIESSDYFSWERFFTKTLVDKSKGTYLEYSKSKLNDAYLQENITKRITAVIPKIEKI